MGNYAEALRAYERALQLNSRLATAWHNKALVLNRLGYYEEALKAAGIEADPTLIVETSLVAGGGVLARHGPQDEFAGLGFVSDA